MSDLFIFEHRKDGEIATRWSVKTFDELLKCLKVMEDHNDLFKVKPKVDGGSG